MSRVASVLLEVFALLLAAFLLKLDFLSRLCILSTSLGCRLGILFALVGPLGALGLLQLLDDSLLIHSLQI